MMASSMPIFNTARIQKVLPQPFQVVFEHH